MSREVQQLIMAIASPDVATRRAAAESLAMLGPDAAPAAVPLVKACIDDDEQVREWAVAALEELSAPDDTAMKPLEALLDGESLDMGFWAATLLGRMEGAAASTVPTLAAAVTDHPELVVRQRAAWALGKIGKPAASAIPQLEAAAKSDDARLARFATMALDAIHS